MYLMQIYQCKKFIIALTDLNIQRRFVQKNAINPFPQHTKCLARKVLPCHARMCAKRPINFWRYSASRLAPHGSYALVPSGNIWSSLCPRYYNPGGINLGRKKDQSILARNFTPSSTTARQWDAYSRSRPVGVPGESSSNQGWWPFGCGCNLPMDAFKLSTVTLWDLRFLNVVEIGHLHLPYLHCFSIFKLLGVTKDFFLNWSICLLHSVNDIIDVTKSVGRKTVFPLTCAAALPIMCATPQMTTPPLLLAAPEIKATQI